MVIDSNGYEGRSQNRNDEALQDSWKSTGRHGLVTELLDLWKAVEP